MAKRPKVYLAGPDVFLPDAVSVGRRKKELCARFGFEGLYPFDNEISPTAASSERVDLLIYRANAEMIHKADAGIFNLTPFRGPSADVGTVFELGMFVALRKPVFGYTNCAESYLDRIKKSRGVERDEVGMWRDWTGMSIEDFANADNLMVEAPFVEQGHPIVRVASEGQKSIGDLDGFEKCLRWAADSLLKDRAGQKRRLVV
ncbi:MAG: nucleoside 2-deoxyribosyltransferase [Alphaproteobacteria bacterium]|nr:nucleoside 2-deoxyribosyltransferase [Alphaproteobacteria bacterium]